MHEAFHDLLHAIAAAVLVGGGGFLIVRGMSTPSPAKATASANNARAASLSIGAIIVATSVGAGVIHLIAAPEHLEELGVIGLGFLAAGIFQIGWALLFLHRRSNTLDRLGVVINVGIVCAWIWSRTIGLPVDGVVKPEQVGLPDGVSVVLEVVLVALVLSGAAIDDRIRRHASTATGLIVGAVPVVGVILLGSLLAVGQLTGTAGSHSSGVHAEPPGHVEEHAGP